MGNRETSEHNPADNPLGVLIIRMDSWRLCPPSLRVHVVLFLFF